MVLRTLDGFEQVALATGHVVFGDRLRVAWQVVRGQSVLIEHRAGLVRLAGERRELPRHAVVSAPWVPRQQVPQQRYDFDYDH